MAITRIAADRACGRDPNELHAAFVHQVAGEGHDELGGQRNAGGLDGHQDDQTTVAGGGHHRLDEYKDDGENFFGHSSIIDALRSTGVACSHSKSFLSQRSLRNAAKVVGKTYGSAVE